MSSDEQPPLEPFTDPEMEARLVAYLLGESSDYERAQIEEALAGDPELQALHRRLAEVHELLDASGAGERNPSDFGSGWRLPDERRAAVMETIKAAPAGTSEAPGGGGGPASGRTSRLWKLTLAAAVPVLVLLAIALPVSQRTLGRSEAERPVSARTAVTHAERANAHTDPLPPGLAWADAKPGQAGNSGDRAALGDSISTSHTVIGGIVQSDSRGREELLEKIDVGEVSKKQVVQQAPPPRPDQLASAVATRPPTAPEVKFDAPDSPVETGSPFGFGAQEKPHEERERLADPAQIAELGDRPLLAEEPEEDEAFSSPRSRSRDHLLAGVDTAWESRVPAEELATGPVSGTPVSSARAAGEDEAGSPDWLTRPTGTAFGQSTPTPLATAKPADKTAAAGGGLATAPSVMSRSGRRAKSEATREFIYPSEFDAPEIPQGIGSIANDPTGTYRGATESRRDDNSRRLNRPVLGPEPTPPPLGQVAAADDLVVSPRTERQSRRIGEAAQVDGSENTKANLSQIIIPRIQLSDATVEEAIEFLRLKGRELDTIEPNGEQDGVNIVLNTEGAGEAGLPRISLDLQDVPLDEALRHVTDLAGLKTTFESGAAVVVPLTDVGDELVTRVFDVPSTFSKLADSDDIFDVSTIDPFAPDPDVESNGVDSMEPQGASDVLARWGITFPEGSVAYYNPQSSQLVIRNTQANLDLVAALARQLSPAPKARPAKHAPTPAALDLETLTADEPFSTFSLNVSDVSFKLAQAALLEQGTWPEPGKIRPEEFVNAFDYGDPMPSLTERVACALEQCVHPFLQQRNLVRVSMRTAAAGRATGQPLRLTILLDRSGSMERADREQAVLAAFAGLTSLLGEGDQITVIGFARTPRLLADRIDGTRASELLPLVASAPSEGGTNLEEALRLARESAQRQFADGAQNRIVLITDGAANLGDADPASLQEKVVALRGEGIAFDACGVGAEGFNDEILEALARKGDGRYYFLDKPEDADAGFVRQLAGALRPAARNVKVQVKWNPHRVTRYRLSGFEKHRLNKEDFRDDSVDAAEMAAAEAGGALYQVQVDPAGKGPLGEIFVRFQDAASGQMVERTWTIPYHAGAPRLEEATPSMQLAAVAALFAEKLKGGTAGDPVDLGALFPIANTLRGGLFGSQQRAQQLADMIQQARGLQP